jgi:hypothetical protein
MTDQMERQTERGGPAPAQVSANAFTELLHAFEAVRVPLAGDPARAEAAHRREALKHLIEARFPDAKWQELMQRARAAAERGDREYLLARFPSDSCSDRGRAIVEQEPGWAHSLTGAAADLYRHFRTELQPQGFRLRAEILEFPGGIPGDFGLFLAWK